MGYHVIIPAAGQGKRMNAGKNKQFIELEGKPIIIHTLEVFEKDPLCQAIILCVNEREMDTFKELLSNYKIKKVVNIVLGGAERQQSVFNGIKALKNCEIVLIHDGARPFISHSSIHRLVEVTEKRGAAILGVPVKDTIKSVHSNSVDQTLDRSSLWAIQTPQAFRLSLILNAHEKASNDDYLGTDDASLVERLDETVYIVEGDYKNIKLTTQDDLLFASAIIESEKRGVSND